MMIFALKQVANRAATLSCAVLVCMVPPALAQTAPPQSAVPVEAWSSNHVTELIGLPAVRQDAKGTLTLSPTALVFTSATGGSSVERAKLLSVSAGFERKESGGNVGRISRAFIPFGGGIALAATATNKEVGLLTIEFRDASDALHGAVFQLPKAAALQAEQQFGSPTASTLVEQPHRACPANSLGQNKAVKIDALESGGVPVPAEYRVLLYEQLITKLRDQHTFSAVYRDGDNSTDAECPQYDLTLTLNAFTKGNAALRASTGPVGLFVGATSLTVHVAVHKQNGSPLLEKDLKMTQRGDTESLDVADRIAKSLNKSLKKQLAAQNVSELASK